MQVFKALMKIFSRSLASVVVYLVIFLGIVLILDTATEMPTIESFENQKVSVAVIDRDNSVLSGALAEYMGRTQNLVEIEDDEDAIQDALFFREVQYLVVIPENFSADLEDGKEPKLDVTKVPGTQGSVFADMKLEEFLTIFRGYRELGMDGDAALVAALENQKSEVGITMITEEGIAEKIHDFAYFFQLMPYGLVSILVNLIGVAVIAFGKEDMARRIRCSSTPLLSRNLQMLAGCILGSVIVWVVIMILAFVRYGEALINSGVLGWVLLNSAACTLLVACLSYLVGLIAREKYRLSGITTSVSLAFCFLGGVFVSMDLMSEGVRKVSVAIPFSWYVKANDILSTSSQISGTNRNEILLCVLIQCLFAVAFFAIALLVGRMRNARESA